MTIYIVASWHNGYLDLIESTWSTRELAISAIHYHANRSGKSFYSYTIMERELNAAIDNKVKE